MSKQSNIIVLTATWALGGFLAIAALALVCAYTLDSSAYEKWDDELGEVIPVPGTRRIWYSEGQSITHFGDLGLVGVSDLRGDARPKVLIVGDSHVEAFQVEDDKKFGAQVNSLLEKKAIPLSAVAIGHSGASVADYYFWRQSYAPFLGEVKYCFIVAAFGVRWSPDAPNNAGHFYASSPTNHFVRKPRPQEGSGRWHKLIFAIQKYRLQIIGGTLRSTGLNEGKSLWADLIFIPGPRKKETRSDEQKKGPSLQDIKYALHQLREQQGRLVIIYTPKMSAIRKAGELDFKEDEKQFESDLVRACQEMGVPVINLKERFFSEFRETGQLPYGFSNTRPGEGHFNELGIRLISEEISKFIEMNP